MGALYVLGVRVSEWFADRGIKGMLTRMVGAWVFVGVPVILARIWWSWQGAPWPSS